MNIMNEVFQYEGMMYEVTAIMKKEKVACVIPVTVAENGRVFRGETGINLPLKDTMKAVKEYNKFLKKEKKEIRKARLSKGE